MKKWPDRHPSECNMSTLPAGDLLNRELGILEFNARVLAQAADLAQLRGEAGERQVAGARVGVVSSGKPGRHREAGRYTDLLDRIAAEIPRAPHGGRR